MHGKVELREFFDEDLPMALELATDPYVPSIGTLPANATEEQAVAWIRRQRARFTEHGGFSFAIVDAEQPDRRAVGQCGLFLRELKEGRATAGYSIVPSARGRGLAADALMALTTFAWSIADLHRVALHIEPWNIPSIRTAERTGYQREGMLRSHQEIAGLRRDMLVYSAIRSAWSRRLDDCSAG